MIGKKGKARWKDKSNAYSVSLLHPKCNIKGIRDFTLRFFSFLIARSSAKVSFSLLCPCWFPLFTAEGLMWHKQLPVSRCLDVWMSSRTSLTCKGFTTASLTALHLCLNLFLWISSSWCWYSWSCIPLQRAFAHFEKVFESFPILIYF